MSVFAIQKKPTTDRTINYEQQTIVVEQQAEVHRQGRISAMTFRCSLCLCSHNSVQYRTS